MKNMVEIIGQKLELADKVVRGDYAYPKKIDSLATDVEIKPEEYALVHQGEPGNLKADSAISMAQKFNGKNHLNTNIEVLKSGLAVPRTPKLATQIINVNNALNEKGVLYDASGNLIEGERLRDYAHIINHNCRVWLNESFEKGNGFLDLDVVYITGLRDGKPVFERESLQKCLEQDCYADLESVNSQGFPTRKSPIQKYEPGKSAYFFYPRENRAGRFDAVPDLAGFYCDRDPQFTVARLGVFSCAEGTHKNLRNKNSTNN